MTMLSSYLRELPRYRCHKTVSALQIKYVIANPRGFELHFFDDGYAPAEVSSEWRAKHEPKPGDYFVVYADGYQSVSPAKAFEDGYTLLSEMPPAEALGEMVVAAALAGYRPFIGQTFSSATSLNMLNFEVRHDGSAEGMIEALREAIELASRAS